MTPKELAYYQLINATVLLTPEAQGEFDALPGVIRARVLRIFERLASWPALLTPQIIVVRIKHRPEVYED